MSHDRLKPCAPETTIDMQGIKMMLNKTFYFFHINICNKHALLSRDEFLSLKDKKIKFFVWFVGYRIKKFRGSGIERWEEEEGCDPAGNAGFQIGIAYVVHSG